MFWRKRKRFINQKRGKFIVLYGINNLGKSTQAKLLVDRLNLNGCKAEYLKYPIYDLFPSGKILNNYLREGNKYDLTPKEAQIFYAKNRTQFEPNLIKKLEAGINIVAEDYTGTGLAWGIGASVNEEFLKYINSHLLREDLALLFDGERFKEATEKNHKHETDDTLINKVRQAHIKLGEELGWRKINANLTIKEIHEKIWNEVVKLIGLEYKLMLPPNFKNLHDKEKERNILKIEKLSLTAKIPTRAHEGDAGLDLYADDDYTLFPDDTTRINTGIKMKIPTGYVGLVWDKSSLANLGIHTLAGVIDSNYRGEIIIILKNLSQDILNISHGQKIAQILIQKLETPEIEEDEIDDKTERGEEGFGSSGLF